MVARRAIGYSEQSSRNIRTRATLDRAGARPGTQKLFQSLVPVLPGIGRPSFDRARLAGAGFAPSLGRSGVTLVARLWLRRSAEGSIVAFAGSRCGSPWPSLKTATAFTS